jgi:hypothetical protein
VVGWCTDKGSGFFIGPCWSMYTATITISNKTIYEGICHSLLLQPYLEVHMPSF